MKHEELTRRIIRAAMEVHNHLGNGFREVIYQRALSLELNLQGITHEREKKGRFSIKGRRSEHEG